MDMSTQTWGRGLTGNLGKGSWQLPLTQQLSEKSDSQSQPLELRLDRIRRSDQQPIAPRNTLERISANKLTDVELLALLLVAPRMEQGALKIAESVIQFTKGVRGLSDLSLRQLLRIKGLERQGASRIMAALELAERIHGPHPQAQAGEGPRFFAELLRPTISEDTVETMHVFFLNQAMGIIAEKEVFKGGLNRVIVDARVIFRIALELSATQVILCHNHPSGNLKPSEPDCACTSKVIEVGKILEIPLVDHIIISREGYLSMKAEGLMDALGSPDWSWPTVERIIRNARGNRWVSASKPQRTI
jgi:DNA repair protein RadC